MIRIGSHVSVAGGLEKGVKRALDVGCDVIQIFTKNNNRWSQKPLTEDVIAAWNVALEESGITAPIAHASYLINLASPDDALWQKSIDALVDELHRAQALHLDGLVVHPGAFTKSSEPAGISRIIEGVVQALQQADSPTCRLLLENTAGQGSCLGHTFEQLAAMYNGVADQLGDPSDRLGFCFDTCHAFAAGYEIHQETGFKMMKKQWQDLLPMGSIRALHLNDSKKPLGSRVDRHEHIGRGEIGLKCFELLLADEDFAAIPGYLETEKGIDAETERDWDVINLEVLRGLIPS